MARGDLSQKITVDVRGELLELKNTINTMVDQLSLFADEVTRVAGEVGTEGNLGGQAEVKGVSGTWKDLTDNVNSMAGNLTAQVRNIAHVATAVARGDLSQKITVDVKGELLELKDTINTMVDQLSSFADEVSRVAYEVGTEGKLGGQAKVPGVGGTWKDLTTNVNSMASNLTTEVRAIAEVATAVTHGELTRTIDVEARGEVAELKDNINYMIRNLRETTQKSAEQDWLKTNLARISGAMQGQRDLRELSRLVMSEVTPMVFAQHGAFFMAGTRDGAVELKLIASYAFTPGKGASTTYRFGEGLVGQAAVERKPIVVTDPPEGYLRVASGIGEGPPAAIVVLPVVFEEQVLAVIELASLRSFSPVSLSFLEQLVETLGVVLSGVIANTRTEELLAESQRLAQELRDQSIELQQGQESLRQTNAELEEKASQLEEQNRSIELKNQEIEIAKRGLEQKARQLATSSKYKSEFLANMSHELRTPLNSLMVLAQLLASNPEDTLTPKQVEFAETIYKAGRDLLDLIHDILDLSKVEAGRLDINPSQVAIADVRESIEQGFGPLAEQKGLALEVAIGAECPPTFVTDAQRLQQILNNLLSNALKFTNEGALTIRIDRAPDGLAYSIPQLEEAGKVLAFTVSDTGIGIAPDQLDTIFEAFRQADGTTSRRFGGTGLGLSISREVSRLLGGEIRVESSVDEGSRFTLYLPERYRPVEPLSRDVARPSPPHAEVAPAEPDAIEREDAEPPMPLAGMAVEDAQESRDRGLAGATILIVDDDARNVFALTNLLEGHGSTVLCAQTGREAVDVLYRNPETDLIVLDIMMPEMDGYETTRTIRGTPQFADLPIIALTARAMKGDREKTLAAGATDYISKPVEVVELVAKIRACLHR